MLHAINGDLIVGFPLTRLTSGYPFAKKRIGLENRAQKGEITKREKGIEYSNRKAFYVNKQIYLCIFSDYFSTAFATIIYHHWKYAIYLMR